MDRALNTPILFIIFNRPETTRRVFAEIRRAKPTKLFIAADGPRSGKSGEEQLCTLTRKEVLDNVDWECEVQTLLRERNLGCRKAVSSAISWFFERVDEGIVLEDDCLPHPDFFQYCSELLKRYREDERVMMISGDNFQRGHMRGEESYYFSKIPHIWGWASWRRAWQHYSVDMEDYREFKSLSRITDIFDTPGEQRFWLTNFNMVAEQNMDTWDFQWVYAIVSNSGLCVAPNVNLISNIGFGGSATRTTNGKDPNANLPTQSIGEIVHPKHVLVSRTADLFTAKEIFFINTEESSTKSTDFIAQLKQMIKKLLKK